MPINNLKVKKSCACRNFYWYQIEKWPAKIKMFLWKTSWAKVPMNFFIKVVTFIINYII